MWCAPGLGPILFKFYINDLYNLDLNSNLILYADDAVVYYSNSCLETAIRMMQKDLDKIYNWTNYNKLTINITIYDYRLAKNDQ